MRAPFSAALTVGLMLFSACSSSGGSTTSGTTTGSSTTTTGGTTTGGGLLSSGKPCGSNSACASGVCGLNGSGNCCTKACDSTNATCAATACDSTGACVYPGSGVSCGSSCSGATLSQDSCDSAGNCKPESGGQACSGNFNCVVDGGCKTACSSIVDCATGFACNGGACIAPLATGPCTENDACASGFCGANGTGNCCTSQCATDDATCGATGCDGTSGVCIYPAATTACGTTVQSCTGNTETDPSNCNGLGGCVAPPPHPCSPFVCGATQCLTGCTDNTSCASGDFCDVAIATCCSGLTTGATLMVDSVLGDDTKACCGLGSNQPCKTLHHATALITASTAQNVTLVATVNATGGDWTPTGEQYPIVLTSGMELQAAGVFFSDVIANEIFDIVPGTPATASLVGTAVLPIQIGMTSQGQQATDPSAIQVEAGATLYIADAVVNGSGSFQSNALTVSAGASLVIGSDSSAATVGGIFIGNDLEDPAQDGFNGIFCLSANGLGCSVSDVNANGPSVTIQGQEGYDIYADDFASIALSSQPTIGLPPSAAGFQKCDQKLEAVQLGQAPAAVLLNGAAQMTFNNGSVSCVTGAGFYLQASGADLPTLNMDSTTIQGTEIGVYASAGTATISNSTIWYNYNGIIQDTDQTNNATIDLSGGTIGGTNTIVCSNEFESVVGKGGGPPGVSVLNTTSDVLTATGVDWDTSGPDLFACDATLTDCTCQNGSCIVDAGGQGMDAVFEGAGTVDTSGNGLSGADCDTAPDQGGGCGPGNPCPPGRHCCPANQTNPLPYCSPGACLAD